MDLSIVTDGWPYHEDDDAHNVRKVAGVDGTMKLQLRIRSGVIQWELDGRPDGQHPFGRETMLEYCQDFVSRSARRPAEAAAGGRRLTEELESELVVELLDYHRRCRALFHLGDYRRALRDALHCLDILELIRERCHGDSVFNYDRYRPALLVDRARAEMLMCIEDNDIRRSISALSRGITEIEDFYVDYELDEQVTDSAERQMLIDLRRSLREKHNVPLDDEELLRSLRSEQEIAIRHENYEMAARLRDKIRAVQERLAHRD